MRRRGLDLMNFSGNEYVVASSPYMSSETSTGNPTYPPYPGKRAVGPTGTISAIQLDPIANTVTIATSSEPSTAGQPYTSSASANFSFTTADAVSSVACSLDGSAFGPCTSETTAQYSGLAGGQHTFKVQTTDGAGNTATASYSWTIESTPANTALPTVTGTTQAGKTLTATTGSWTGNPLSYTYQWQRCDTKGLNCAVLHTATPTYPLGITDVGHTLRVRVTATNSAGSQSATSAATPTVTVCPSSAGGVPAYCDPPKRIVRPTVTGTTQVGQTLVADTGTWSKLAASQYGGAQYAQTSVQWLRCDAHGAHCVAIAKATHTNYKVTKKDQGVRLKLRVVASNRNGTTIALSGSSAPIVPAGTKVTLVLSAPGRQRLLGKGYAMASVRSNVGTRVDVSVGVTVNHGATSWTSGTPAEALPGRVVKFKVALSRTEIKRLRRAVAAHHKLSAVVSALVPWLPWDSAAETAVRHSHGLVS